MKKLLLVFFLFISLFSFSQQITPVFYPRYIQGHGTGATSDERRIPYACRMTITGLSPNTTYYYYNRWATSPANPVEQGGMIFPEQFGNWVRVTTPSLATAGLRDTLVTNSSGSYTGWFISESSIATTEFAPGTQLYFRVVLDVPGGTNPLRATASTPVTVLAWEDYLPVTPDSVGTGVRSVNNNTNWLPKNFIMLYDNEAGTGRPIAGTYIESDGVANTAANGYIGWYASATTGVNGFNNRWGTILPNNLPNGIRRIAQYTLSNGNLVNSCTDDDGDWGGTNGNTVDPSGGGANDPSVVRIINCITTGTCNISLSTTVTNIACFANNTGAVNLTVNGATAPVTYNWSNGSTTEDINAVIAGSYNVIVTDANSCTATMSVTITQPASALNASLVATNATCGNNNGSVNLTASGGTAPYSYLWNNGATTEDISNLPAGTYTVTVTDASSCSKTSTVSVNSVGGATITINSTVNVSCFGGNNGAINITVTGGTTPYNFTWSNGAITEDINGLTSGSYTVTVTDGTGCPGIANATITQPAQLTASSSAPPITIVGGTTTVTVTAAGGTAPYTGTGNFIRSTGTYTFIVTDANGCTANTTITLSEPGCNIGLTTSVTNISCHGGNNGSINLSVTGASGTVSYNWSNGATTEDIAGLTAGNYTAIVTDQSGCVNSITATITQPLNAISINTVSNNILCFGQNTGSINNTLSGGISPYTFSWSNGATTEDVNGLAAGTYTVSVTDAAGCTVPKTISITQPSQLIASENHTNISCYAGASTVTIAATGGTAPYTGTGTFTRTSGNYIFTITDANGCTATVNAIINQPQQLTAHASTGTITCSGGTTTVIIGATGGTAPYSGTGSYTRGEGSWDFTITDANGCTAATTVIITAQPTFTVSSTAGTILCSGATTTVTVAAIGSTGPFTGTGTFTRGAGTWNFTITDNLGCTIISTITIIQPDSLKASSSPGIISCTGGSSTVTVTATGGTAPYTGTGTFVRSPGSYSYTVTDANGCTSVTTGTITEPAVLKATAIAEPIKECGGTTLVTVSATGGTAPYRYPGAGTYLREAGTWNFSVTDAMGCIATATITIEAAHCLEVYPNPGKNEFKISHSKAGAGAAIYVYDLNGKLLVTQPVAMGSIHSRIDMSRYAAGVYVLVYANEGEKMRTVFQKLNE